MGRIILEDSGMFGVRRARPALVLGLACILAGLVAAEEGPMYGADTDVVSLTASNFEQLVVRSGDLWMVEFFAPWCGHCKAFRESYAKLARILKGIVKVGAVDMTVEQSVGSKYNIQGFPTFTFFGAKKDAPEQYNSARSVEGMVDFVFEKMRSVVNSRMKSGHSGSSRQSHQESKKEEGGSDESDVVVLTDQDFEQTLKASNEMWLVEFYAPWCGHCKNLQPQWNIAASKLKGKVRFGKVDATAQTQIAQRFQIQAYPTIKVFPPGGDLSSPIEYDGGRTADTIESAALKYLERYPPKKEVFQLTNQKVFDSECANKKGVCVILFLPHLYDTKAEGRRKMIGVLEEAAKRNTIYPYYYFWSQAYDQKMLERALALGAGYPAVVSISPSKKKFSVMRGAYTVDAVSSYLKDLIRGFERVNEYKEIQTLKEIEKWDGEDMPEPTSDL